MNPFEAMLEHHRADPAAFRQRVQRKARAMRAREIVGFFSAVKKAFHLRTGAPRTRVQVA
jgi:hypothetical protein